MYVLGRICVYMCVYMCVCVFVHVNIFGVRPTKVKGAHRILTIAFRLLGNSVIKYLVATHFHFLVWFLCVLCMCSLCKRVMTVCTYVCSHAGICVHVGFFLSPSLSPAIYLFTLYVYLSISLNFSLLYVI